VRDAVCGKTGVRICGVENQNQVIRYHRDLLKLPKEKENEKEKGVKGVSNKASHGERERPLDQPRRGNICII